MNGYARPGGPKAALGYEPAPAGTFRHGRRYGRGVAAGRWPHSPVCRGDIPVLINRRGERGVLDRLIRRCPGWGKPGAAGARRPRHRQDRAAELPGRSARGTPGSARGGRADGDGACFRWAASAVCADAGPAGSPAGAAAGGAADCVRPERRAAAGRVPGGAGRARPAGGGGRETGAHLPGHRRAVARPRSARRWGRGAAAGRPTRSAWCSPPGSPERNWPGCRNSKWEGSASAMRGRCSSRYSPARWTPGCGTSSSRRRGVTRWRCWNYRGA